MLDACSTRWSRPKRQAVLLLGGDKTGDDRFYERMIPQSEGLLAEYLAGLDE
jgi:hypothetical protein